MVMGQADGYSDRVYQRFLSIFDGDGEIHPAAGYRPIISALGRAVASTST